VGAVDTHGPFLWEAAGKVPGTFVAHEPGGECRLNNVSCLPNSNAIRQDTNGLPQGSLNHHMLERLTVGLLAEHMHLADGSVQDVIETAPKCYSRSSWHDNIC
jgi:hypothetical protein